MQRPPPGYYPPPGYGPGYQPPAPPPSGSEGSKTLSLLIGGCLALVALIVIGPWVGCAVCGAIGTIAREAQEADRPKPVLPAPRPAPVAPRRR